MHPHGFVRRGASVLALAATLGLGACATCTTSQQAGRLAEDWTAQRPTRGLAKDMPMADALCLRDALVAELGKTQGRIVGYKAGLTNKAVQQRFGHPAPVRGTLFEKMMLADGAEVPAKFGARPVFEADLVVEVGDEAINEAKTPAEVLRHVAKIYPFIELPDLVVAEGEPLNGPVITAINVGARLGVLGKPIAPDAAPGMANALASMTVTMRDQDGKELGKGPGAAILDHPLNAVVWLAEDVARSGGRLRKGDLLSLGSFTPLVPPKPNTAITVTYDGLPGNPSVSVRFK